MRSLALLVVLCAAIPASADSFPREGKESAAARAEAAGRAAVEDPVETPISVPSTVPVGFLVAWKPSIISVRIDSGKGGEFGSDTFGALRGLGRYTTTLFGEKLLARAEIEGGQFRTDTQGTRLGSNGFDLTVRALGGTATRINQSLTVTASAGLITRYQRGTEAQGGAPRIGILGVTSNLEFGYRIAPAVSLSAFLEGGLAPLAYGTQPNVGVLSDASELRLRLQVSVDLSPKTAVDIGYDFTRWHASFAGSTVLGNTTPDALLLEAREQALTLGVRWKP